MMRRARLFAPWVMGLTAWTIAAAIYAAPTVYPTGTTIYRPDRAWNGYTVFIAPEDIGAIVVDMNGNTVKHWTGYHGGAGGPARLLPGGHVLAGGPTRAPFQESNALIQMDWDGNVVWQFDRTEEIRAGGERFWSARAHHDWQRQGSPTGYYAPGFEPLVDGGRTLVLAHKNLTNHAVSDKEIQDDYIVEVSWEGEVLWEWLASDHVDEFGFSADAREVIRRAPNFSQARQSTDWMHINSVTYVGPNRWHDAGDARFHPDNVIISSRQANIVAIVARDDGAIVWRMGPDYRASAEMHEIGQVIGQHHPHIIPPSLPGAGNLLVYDNGGAGGYGFANPIGPTGVNALGRGSSRVLEINPVTMEVVWSYSMPGREAFKFYSSYISSVQRLENGNTMITEGADGRIFEVTVDGEIVWEYVSPYFREREAPSNAVYRAYRVPYGWIPQLARPAERAVIPPELSQFRVPPQ